MLISKSIKRSWILFKVPLLLKELEELEHFPKIPVNTLASLRTLNCPTPTLNDSVLLCGHCNYYPVFGTVLHFACSQIYG